MGLALWVMFRRDAVNIRMAHWPLLETNTAGVDKPGR